MNSQTLWSVHKFGGASVKDADAIVNLYRVASTTPAAQRGDQLAIVVSAMGKTTNALETALAQVQDGVSRQEALAEIFAAHRTAASDLGLGEDVLNDAFEGLLSAELNYNAWVSWGEHFSTLLVAAYLNKCGQPTRWLDASELICTDDRAQAAVVDETETSKNIALAGFEATMGQFGPMWIVTQGFIGGYFGAHGVVRTTLGREGSDYSGALIAQGLSAEELTIWKDVPGMMNADPEMWPGAVRLPEVDFDDALAMSQAGAGVIHEKTVLPLKKEQIALHIKCFSKPDAPGTVVGRFPGLCYAVPLMAFMRVEPEGAGAECWEVTVLRATAEEAISAVGEKFPDWEILKVSEGVDRAVVSCRVLVSTRLR